MFFLKNKKFFNRGFTLLEMVVVAGIVTVVSSIILSNYGKFNNKTYLRSLAYEIALTIRQAQSYGIFVKESIVANVSSFEFGYGVHFDKSPGYNNYFVLFSDRNRDKKFALDVVDGEKAELLENLRFQGGVVIDDLLCSGNSISVMDVFFLRPNPEAIFSTGETRESVNINNSCQEAVIRIKSSSGEKKDIVVMGVGQIYVRDTPVQ